MRCYSMKKFFPNIKVNSLCFFSKHNFICALSVSFVFLCFFLLFFYPCFDTNDDNFMIAILNSAYGSSSEQAVYINHLFARLIIALQSRFTFICWYSLFLFASTFLSMVATNYTLIKLFKSSPMQWIILFTINVFCGYEFYVYPQFTKTAGLCTIAGFLLINLFIITSTLSPIVLLLGIFLMLSGSLWRFSSFGMTCIALSALGFTHCYYLIKEKKHRSLFKYVLTFLITMISIMSINKISLYISKPNEDWLAYQKCNSLRAELLDFGFPDYNVNKELYSDLNISLSDLDLYKNWNFADPNIFNLSSMQKLVSAKENTNYIPLSFSSILYAFKEIVNNNILCYIFLLCIVLFLWNYPYKSIVCHLLCIVAYLFVELYLIYIQRYGVPRTEVPFVFAIGITLLASTAFEASTGHPGTSKQFYPHKHLHNILSIICISLAFSPLLFLNSKTINKEIQAQNNALFQYIAENKQCLFLVEDYTHDDIWTKTYGVFTPPTANCADNYYVLGGWTYQSPITNQILENYNVQNPFKDVVDAPSIYYINNSNIDNDAIIKYIQRHYSPTAYPVLVKKIGQNHIYKIYSH